MPIEVKEKEIWARVQNPDLFDPDSFRQKSAGEGINLVLGKKKGSDVMEVQSIRFDKEKWNEESAKKWMDEHKDDFSKKNKEDANIPEDVVANEPAPEKPKIHNIEGVEIFSAGTWNEDTYTEEDLDEMVRAFAEMGQTLKPPLKLGHSENQKLLQEDGLPAAGWVGKLYRKGEKLLADFIDIPTKIHDLIKNKAYRKVSSEIYWNFRANDTVYKKMLGAVALLGDDLPAVSNLSDILSLYGYTGQKKFYEDNGKDIIIKVCEYTNQVMEDQDMSKELEKKVEDLLKENESLKKEYSKKEEEIISEKKVYQKKLAEFEAKEKEAKIESFIAELTQKNLCAKSMETNIKELLSDDVKEYTLAEGKKGNKQECLASLLSKFSELSKVNFKESSKENEVVEKSEDDKLHEKILKYCKDNGLDPSKDYRKAYNLVKKEMN